RSIKSILGNGWSTIGDVLKDILRAALILGICYGVIVFSSVTDPLVPRAWTEPFHSPLQVTMTLVAVGFAGMSEEITFRGYLLSQYALLVKREWIAGFLQATVFAIAHGFDQTPNEFLSRLILGLIFAISRRYFDSLLPAI